MTVPRPTLRDGLPALLGVLLLLAACTGGAAEQERTPEEVLAAAKTHLDETSGLHIDLVTEELPAGVDGVLRAAGVGTHDPAFEGDLKVSAGGVQFDVPVVATGGVVYAQLPFTQEFVEVNPSDYGAPDPAGLMAADGGLSSLLTAVEAVEEGDQVRSGEDLLAAFMGTVPGEAVAGFLPQASAEDDFDATFTVDDEDRLREAVLTGPFYPGADPVTYTITFSDYDTAADITAP
jgi:lipoprotein LprG